LCGVGHITAQAFVLTLRSKQRFLTFQVTKQKAVSKRPGVAHLAVKLLPISRRPVSFGISRCLK
jgi:hypothetical protein